MSGWSVTLRWFLLRALLLLATLLAPGCGYSTYNIPLAELQRLSHLPPSQRGNHVRVYTPGLVPAATPELEITVAPVAAPAALPDALSPAPLPFPSPPPEAATESEPINPPIPLEVVDISVPQFDPLSPPAFVSASAAPPAPARMSTPIAGRPSLPRPSLGHVSAPRAFPVHGAAPAFHASGGLPRLGGGGHHSGGGGGGAAVGAVVGAVVLVGLMVAIADASQPTPFDGWISTSPEQTLQLIDRSGSTREVRLCDLKPADTVGVRFASLDDMNGSVRRLESAASTPPTTPPPRLAAPPAIAPRSVPPAAPAQPPPAPRMSSSSDPFSYALRATALKKV
jgi:hypothetical protein